MASLVADYGSDSSTASEDDEDPGPEGQRQRVTGTRHSNEDCRASPLTARDNPERNYFMPEDSEDEEEEEETTEGVDSSKSPSSDSQQQQNAVKLPKPNFGWKSPARPNGNEGVISVFANPYRAAEEARNSLLEKHVKMTPTGNNQQRSIMGKKVCWNYRKGRCRFGSTCKFAHDSDIAVNKKPVSAVESEVADGVTSFSNQRH